MIFRIALLAALMAARASAAGTDDRFRFPETRDAVEGQAMLLAIDDVAWPLKGGLCAFMTRPAVRREPILVPERGARNAPDNLAVHLYGTVLHDQGRFRMWYYAAHLQVDGKDMVQGPICYAESPDGLNWHRSVLGQVEFNGSRNNNIIAIPAEVIEGVQVIRDDTDPDPNLRYKMIYNCSDRRYHFTMRTATSSDGLHWTAGPEDLIGSFMEFASLYQKGGFYFINTQIWGRTEGGRAEGREAYVWVGQDFQHWLQEPALSFALPTPAVGSGVMGHYDQLHLGIGAQNFGNVVIGLYARWHEQGWGIGGTSADLGLVLSHDGIHFYEPVKGYTLISAAESPVTPVPGKNYPTILTQSNSLLNYGDETRIYHGRWRNTPDFPAPGAEDYSGEVALATIPRDRWGALGLFPAVSEGFIPVQEPVTHAASQGAAWSMAIRLPAEKATRIILNADRPDLMRVEVGDERFSLLPDYSGDKAGRAELRGGLDCPIAWPGQGLEGLRGKTVRLRIVLRRGADAEPRLYAVYLRTD